MDLTKLENEVINILEKVKNHSLDFKKIINETETKIKDCHYELQKFNSDEMEVLYKSSEKVKRLVQEINTIENSL